MPRDAALLRIELRDMPDETGLGLPECRATARRQRPAVPLTVAAMLTLLTFAVLLWSASHAQPVLPL
jgi:hypothetical protein